jgi:hypothetical protein
MLLYCPIVEGLLLTVLTVANDDTQRTRIIDPRRREVVVFIVKFIECAGGHCSRAEEISHHESPTLT